MVHQVFNSTLLRDASIYATVSFVSAIVGFLVLPLLTKYLTPDDYGTLELFRVLIALLTGIILFGGNTIIVSEYYRLEVKERNSLFQSIVNVVFIMGTIIFTIYYTIYLFAPTSVEKLHLDAIWVSIAVITAIASSVSALTSTMFQISQRPKQYAIFTISMLICSTGISLLLVILYGMGWKGMAIGVSLTAVIYLFISLKMFSREGVRYSPSLKYGKLILTLGPALALSHLAGWLNEGIDKFMISNMMDIETTGIYSVGYKFGMMVMIITTAYSRSWLSFFYKNINIDNIESKKKIVLATYLSVLSLFIISFCIGIIGSPFMKYLIDERYSEGASIILIISLAYYIDGVGKLFTGYLVHCKKIGLYSTFTILSGILNLGLNFVLIPRYGMHGAAWATFFSFSFGTLATMTTSFYIHPMPWFSFRKN